MNAKSQSAFFATIQTGVNHQTTDFKPVNAKFQNRPYIAFNGGFGYSKQIKNTIKLETFAYYGLYKSKTITKQAYDNKISESFVDKTNQYVNLQINVGYMLDKFDIYIGNTVGYAISPIYKANGKSTENGNTIQWENEFEPRQNLFDAGINLGINYSLNKNFTLGVDCYFGYTNINNWKSYYPNIDYPYANYFRHLVFTVKYNFINF